MNYKLQIPNSRSDNGREQSNGAKGVLEFLEYGIWNASQSEATVLEYGI
jgi:hypothetical protein